LHKYRIWGNILAYQHEHHPLHHIASNVLMQEM
jgi:hypothetical protein